MTIVNYRIKKMTAERSDLGASEVGNVDVNSNFLIVSMSKKNDPTIGDYLLVNFKFNVYYKPDLGRIDMDGFLWYTEKELEKTVAEKAGKVEIQPEALKEISTTILRDSLLEATDIARKLRLPIPLNLPKVNVPKEAKFPKAA
jgi:hypothetical protein